MKTSNFNLPPDLLPLFLEFSELEGTFFLDSSDQKGFSFLGALPYKTLSTLDDLNTMASPPLSPPLGNFPFQGGAVGFLSYDAVRQWEPHLSPAKKEPFNIPKLRPYSGPYFDVFFL